MELLHICLALGPYVLSASGVKINEERTFHFHYVTCPVLYICFVDDITPS